MENTILNTDVSEHKLPDIQKNLSLESDTTQDNDLLKQTVYAMETLMKQEFHAPKAPITVNPLYRYARSSFRNKIVLIHTPYNYEAKNRKPPKASVNINTVIAPPLKLPLLKNDPQAPATEQRLVTRDKDIRGQEESVKNHTYNDLLPMALSVKDFKELYTPKSIQYMWSANDLEYNVAMTLKEKINHYLSLSITEQALYMSSITDVRQVTLEDCHDDACDPELVGHRGLFAKKDIPEMSVIGVYTGIFIADVIDIMILSEKMPSKHLQDYLFRVPLKDKYPKITGYQYGNRLSLINAASNYKGDDETIFNQLCRRSNIMLVSGKSNECPISKIAHNENCPDVLFFIAGRDIPVGSQLLYDYGNLYW